MSSDIRVIKLMHGMLPGLFGGMFDRTAPAAR